MSRATLRSRAWPVARSLAIVAPMVAPFLILELPIRLREHVLGVGLRGDRPSVMVLVFYAVAYGVFRVVAFHPACRPGYRAWLESSPWTAAKRLPLGPVELSWRDGLVLGLLIALSATLPEPHAPALLCTFLLAHLLAMAPTFWATGCPAFGYATAFATGAAVRLWHQPVACVAALAAVYAMAYEGLWRGMARFPEGWPKVPFLSEHPDPQYRPRPPCGWPYDRMVGEVTDDRMVRRSDAVLGCLLATWWADSLISLIPDPRNRLTAAVVSFAAATQFAWLIRLWVYVAGYRSPLGLWGRIRTLRPIVPGYDQVFIGPLCVPVVGGASLALLRACRVPLPTCFTTAAGMALLAALLTPPSLRRWRLTGRHRIAATQNANQPKDKNPFVQVT